MDPEKLNIMMHLARKIKTKRFLEMLQMNTLTDLRDIARKEGFIKIQDSIIRKLPKNSRKDFEKCYQKVYNKKIE